MAPKSGKSKKGKKKKRKAISAKSKLEQEADLYIQQDELHKTFIQRIGKWMLSNFGRVIDIFHKFDQNGDGLLSYEEFFAGMRDLAAPFSALELLVLAKTVDKNCDQHIDYTEFSEGIRYQRPVRVWKDDGLPVLKIRREKFEKCPSCNICRWESKQPDDIRFINLEVKYALMAKLKNIPCHLQTIIHSHITIEGVIEMVKALYDYTVVNVTIYHVTDNIKVELKKWQTLKECGFAGGSENLPEHVELFYEVFDEGIDCPLLQCDHYFDRKAKRR